MTTSCAGGWRGLAPVCAAAGLLLSAVPAASGAEILLKAPDAVAPLLRKHAPMLNARPATLDTAEIARLERLARRQIGELLATEGYFSPVIGTEVIASGTAETLVVQVEPGPRTRIGGVRIDFRGDIANAGDPGADPDTRRRALQREVLRSDWSLHPGATFRQEEWTEAKNRLLDAASQKDYGLARISASAARIDPARAVADLSVELDSGPRIVLGAFRYSGLERVPRHVAEKLNGLRSGEPYDREKLLDLQAALQNSGYFSSVIVEADLTGTRALADPEPLPDAEADADDAPLFGRLAARRRTPPAATVNPADDTPPVDDGRPAPANGDVLPPAAPAGEAPATDSGIAPETPEEAAPDAARTAVADVLIRVREGNRQRLGAAVGYSTETGPLLELSYRNVNLFDRGLGLNAAARADLIRRYLFADIHLPQTTLGYRDSVGASFETNDVAGLLVDRAIVGARRWRQQGIIELQYGLRYLDERARGTGIERERLRAFSASWDWTRRNVDDRMNPRAGNVLGAQVVGAARGLGSDTTFVRVLGRAQYFRPMRERDVLSVRVDAGYTVAQEATAVPQEYLFRAGGTGAYGALRGYRYQGIGISSGGTVRGGRALAVGSIEYTHWIDASWGVAGFVDAGDAANSWRELRPVLGVGIGGRWRSPAGPLALDVGWGAQDRRLRLHFTVAVPF